MTASLQRRLGALEAAHGVGVEFIIIECRFAHPGMPTGEIAFADVRGQRFARELGESEDGFLARVRAWAEASASAGQRCASVVVSEHDLTL